MKFGRTNGVRQSLDGRWSVFSGISPMASRNCSVELERRRESAVDGVPLSRRGSREEGRVVDAVAEE